jgi:hypothetical protein
MIRCLLANKIHIIRITFKHNLHWYLWVDSVSRSSVCTRVPLILNLWDQVTPQLTPAILPVSRILHLRVSFSFADPRIERSRMDWYRGCKDVGEHDGIRRPRNNSHSGPIDEVWHCENALSVFPSAYFTRCAGYERAAEACFGRSRCC